MNLQKKYSAINRILFPKLVAEAGIAPAPQGYEPCDLLLVYPAIIIYTIQDKSKKAMKKAKRSKSLGFF